MGRACNIKKLNDAAITETSANWKLACVGGDIVNTEI